ncbi:baseplate J/gp47 family protein [Segnochrobactrum spirostomi]|nr:baseplate J/gp47 family protein [Segnochrobactrum spirostomi]
MSYRIPTPAELIARAETRAEAAFTAVVAARAPDATPAAISRAVRDPRGVIAMLLRVQAMQIYEAHLHIWWWGQQYFPDTAESAQLERHAGIWGLARRAATRAVGYATVTAAAGTAGVAIPIGTLLRGAGSTLYETTAVVTVSAGSGATLSLRAVDAGVAGNAAAATRLSLVSPITGLAAQEAVVDGEGIAGGAAIEADASLLARLLAEIREPAHGGNLADYRAWVGNNFAISHVTAIENYAGRGRVGVVVAMGTVSAPRAATAAELAAIGTYLDGVRPENGVRPVTADVIPVAATLVPVPISVALDPDQVAVRAAVSGAVAAHFATEARIGVLMRLSRLDEAISAASGEYAHRLITPAADIAPAATELPIVGAITWSALT